MQLPVLIVQKTFRSLQCITNRWDVSILHLFDTKTFIWKENAKVLTRLIHIIETSTHFNIEVLFGGSLETYAIEHKTPVPMLVVKCIDAIESMGGLQKEGIYRVPGRQSNIEQLKHQFELDEDRVHLESFDVFTIAAVLKQYIRELGKPLFEFDVQTRSVYSSKDNRKLYKQGNKTNI
jgi:hypothetical protein